MAMFDVALLARIEAEPGKEQEVADLLKVVLPRPVGPAAAVRFALKLGASTFGIFDAVSDRALREASRAASATAASTSESAEQGAAEP